MSSSTSSAQRTSGDAGSGWNGRRPLDDDLLPLHFRGTSYALQSQCLLSISCQPHREMRLTQPAHDTRTVEQPCLDQMTWRLSCASGTAMPKHRHSKCKNRETVQSSNCFFTRGVKATLDLTCTTNGNRHPDTLHVLQSLGLWIL
jgi:hypothetical protein